MLRNSFEFSEKPTTFLNLANLEFAVYILENLFMGASITCEGRFHTALSVPHFCCSHLWSSLQTSRWPFCFFVDQIY